jgi:UPF0716 family protein affecting phage T7 exclusion
VSARALVWLFILAWCVGALATCGWMIAKAIFGAMLFVAAGADH